VNGITYSIYFSDLADLIVFASVIGLTLGGYRLVSRWLTRPNKDDVLRERRFLARVEEYNEARQSALTSQDTSLR
jgi:hypothetical protein